MTSERIFQAVANASFRFVVSEFSFYRGRVILTEADEHAGLLNYINIAQILN